jgi:signal transduction histidine kinase
MMGNNQSELYRAYVLYRIGQTIGKESGSEVQRKILEYIVSGFEASSGCIALHDKDKDCLDIVMGVGYPAKFIGATIKQGEGVMGWVAQHGEPLLLNGDVASDPRFRNLVRKKEKPRSAMCWPLIVDNDVIGVLSINRSANLPPYREQDLEQGGMMVNVISLVIENTRLHAERQHQLHVLRAEKEEQQILIKRLQEIQQQILQADKMASIGQLAAGVAHEINNPVGYISSNIGSLGQYVKGLFRILDAYEGLEHSLAPTPSVDNIRALKAEVDLPHLMQDTRALLDETQEGLTRVKQIVQNLKDFSHVDEAEWQWADLHKGIDSTLNIVNSEIKYKAEVVRDYGDLPAVECIASQLNQVFMNILVNAAQAIDEHGTITIRTNSDGRDWVCIAISDTGAGITPEHLGKIFDPLFTTKPVGQGTGLGLSLSYSIANKHGGRIEVESEQGKGTTFRVWLPVRQQQAMAQG